MGFPGQNPPSEPKEQLKKNQSAISETARKVKEGVFDTFHYHIEFLQKNVELANKVLNDWGTAIEKKLFQRAIQSQKENCGKYYGDCEVYAENIFEKYEDLTKAAVCIDDKETDDNSDLSPIPNPIPRPNSAQNPNRLV